MYLRPCLQCNSSILVEQATTIDSAQGKQKALPIKVTEVSVLLSR